MKFAREMVKRDSAMATGLPWAVQYMDQERNVFCQWSKARGAVEDSNNTPVRQGGEIHNPGGTSGVADQPG